MNKTMDSQNWQLQNSANEQVEVGQVVSNRDMESFELSGGSPPHKPSSTGRVYGTWASGHSGEYFPSVFNLKWVDLNLEVGEDLIGEEAYS